MNMSLKEHYEDKETTGLVDLNFNSYVFVKLTAHGKKLCDKYFQSMPFPLESKATDDWSLEIQLWELIKIFWWTNCDWKWNCPFEGMNFQMIPNEKESKKTQIQTPTYEEVEINGEKIDCKRIDMLKEYDGAFVTADYYRKTATVTARQANERETIATSQDWMFNYAEPGDWIIHNPWDKDPYVFWDKNDPIEKRQAIFAKKYEAIPWEEWKFRAKWVIRAVQVRENIVFWTSWGETMSVKTWGWVADGGYGIAEESFSNTYEKFDPNAEDQKRIDEIKKSL